MSHDAGGTGAPLKTWQPHPPPPGSGVVDVSGSAVSPEASTEASGLAASGVPASGVAASGTPASGTGRPVSTRRSFHHSSHVAVTSLGGAQETTPSMRSNVRNGVTLVGSSIVAVPTEKPSPLSSPFAQTKRVSPRSARHATS
jgi:hypothetical protein